MNSNTTPPSQSAWPVNILAATVFLIPAVGVPNEYMLQDTLKSAIAAFGILSAAVLYTCKRKPTIHLHGLLAIPIALALFAMLSLAWSYTYLAGVETARWVLLSILMWLCMNILDAHQLDRLLWGLHGGISVASIWAIAQFLFNLQVFPQVPGAEPASTFANRNFFAEYAVSMLPLSIWLLVRTRQLGVSLLLAATLGINAVALLMTGTRSALISLFVISFFIALTLIRYRHQLGCSQWTRTHKAGVTLILVCGVITLGNLPSTNPNIGLETTALWRSSSRMESIAQPNEYTEGSFSVRIEMWKTTARMILSNPWFGVGAGSWEMDAPLYQKTADGLEIDFYAHNEFLQILSEYGLLVGGAVLAFLFAYLIQSVEWTLALGTRSPDAPKHAFVLCSLLALLLVSNAGFPLHLASTGTLLAVNLGLLVRARSIKVAMPKQIHSGLILLFTASLGVAAYVSLQAMRSEYKLIHSIHLGNALVQNSRNGTPPASQNLQQLFDEAHESLSINPHPRNLVAMVAEHLENLGDLPHAAQIAEILTTAHPNVPTIRAKLALTYSRLLEHDKAWEQLKVLQHQEPNSLRTQETKLILLVNAQRFQEATAELDQYRNAGVSSPVMQQLEWVLDTNRIHNH